MSERVTYEVTYVRLLTAALQIIEDATDCGYPEQCAVEQCERCALLEEIREVLA